MGFFEIILIILALLVMLVGLVGIFVPVLPGMILIFGAFFLYALLTGFKSISLEAVIVFLVITIVSMAIDYVAMRIGVKKLGGTRWGMVGAFIGSVIGLLLAGLVGVLVGAFSGAVFFEYAAGRGKNIALKAGLGTMVGFIGGALVKFMIGISMIIFFIAKIFSA